MNSTLLAVLSGLFGLFCVGREVRLIIREKRIRIINMFLIMYGVTYGIVLSLLMIFYNTGVYEATGEFLRFDYSPEGLTRTAWWFFAAVIGYISFKLATIVRFRKQEPKAVIAQEGLNAPLLDRLQITSFLCLAIGVVCFTIWANSWGGYMNLFLNAEEIRNGSYGVKNPVAFFAKPAQIVATVSMISLFLIKKKKNIWLNVVFFILSFGISMLYYLAKDGRMVMAMYLLIVLFMWDGTFEKQSSMGKKLIKLALYFVLFVLIVLNMNRLTSALRNDSVTVVEDKTLLESIMGELNYIYVAGQTAVEHCTTQGCPWLIGHDVGSSLFAWVPSALTPKSLINVWDYNTYLIAGADAMAQYPTDLISTSLYDLGILGPILLPAFWGILISKLESLHSNNNSPLFTVLYYSLAMTLVRVVNYSMFSATVASVFHIFVTAVVYWAVRRARWR